MPECGIQFIFDLFFFFFFSWSPVRSLNVWLLFSQGNDLRFDGGLTLATAYWSRSAVLLQLNRGADALVDIQCAIDNGLEPIKTKPEYFARLAKANARKSKANRFLFSLLLSCFFCFFRLIRLMRYNAMRCACPCAVCFVCVWQVNNEKHFSRRYRILCRLSLDSIVLLLLLPSLWLSRTTTHFAIGCIFVA